MDEILKLVVKLFADATQYVKVLDSAYHYTANMANRLAKMGSSASQSFFNGFQQTASRISNLFGPGFASRLANGLTSALGSASSVLGRFNPIASYSRASDAYYVANRRHEMAQKNLYDAEFRRKQARMVARTYTGLNTVRARQARRQAQAAEREYARRLIDAERHQRMRDAAYHRRSKTGVGRLFGAAGRLFGFGGGASGGGKGKGGGGGPLGALFGSGGSGGRGFGFKGGGLGFGVFGRFAGLTGGGGIGMAGGPVTAILGMIVGAGLRAASAAAKVTTAIVKEMSEWIWEGVKGAVKLGMEFERAEITFGVMTGDMKKGANLLGQIQTLATKTPYTTRELMGTGQMLLGMGVTPGSLIPTLNRLGDIAAGDTVRLHRLALAFGQVMSAGRFMGQELRQFTEAGVGVEDFARAAGMSAAQLRANMEAGTVGVDVMVKAINQLTGPGGRFSGLNEQVNKTVSGQWSNLVDQAEISLGKIGKSMFEKFDIAGILNKVTNALTPLQDMIESAMSPIADWAKRAGPTVRELAGIFGGLTGAIAETVKYIYKISPAWDGVRKFMEEISTVIIPALLAGFQEVIKTLVGFAKAFFGVLRIGSKYTGLSVPGLRASDFGAAEQSMKMIFHDMHKNPYFLTDSYTKSREKFLKYLESASDYNPQAGNMALGGVGAALAASTARQKIPIPLAISAEANNAAIAANRALSQGIDPLDKFTKTVSKLNEAYMGPKSPALGGLFGGAGLGAPIGIGAESFEQGLHTAMMDLIKSKSESQSQPAPAALRGSSESQQIINQSMQQQQDFREAFIRAYESQQKFSEEAAKQRKEHTDLLKQLVKEGKIKIVTKGT